MKFSKKGIYGEMNPKSTFGDFYLKNRKELELREKIVIQLLNSRLGWRVAAWFVKQHPEFFVSHLEQALKPLSSLDIDKDLEEHNKFQNFEDIAWLFRPLMTSRKTVQLDFDEAAYLFSLARSHPNCRILEIGRYRGGSTLLFAVAIDDNSKLTSIDNLAKIGCDDSALNRVLEKSKLYGKVELIVQDSTKIKAEPNSYDIVFIDGDHSYEGILRDYEHWKYSVKPGGHLLFHDAAYGRRFSSVLDGPARCANKVQEHDFKQFKKVKEIGSIVHFSRTDNPW
ncbi:MAG: class I SAM-dependent methyltransferase [Patescibacteria group bacterium]